MQKFKTRNLVMCAIFAALIAVGAFIKIPIGIVPITLQVFFCVLAGLLLGPKVGASAIFAYIFIGLTGIPVFTQGGGISYVFQPTFGYLIGFGAGTFLTGFIAEKFKKKTYFTYLIAAFAFVFPTYIVGLPYLYCIINFYMKKTITVGYIMLSYCLVFLPGDILSCFLAAFIAKRLNPILKKGTTL